MTNGLSAKPLKRQDAKGNRLSLGVRLWRIAPLRLCIYGVRALSVP